MEDLRRFSAAPVNFDRFVSLNRSHSRSLSPDHELHQMLRPYQGRTTATTPTTSSSNNSGHRKAIASSSAHAVKNADERRSTDMLAVTSSSTVTIDGPFTQAATPPSRSVSGGAATTTAGASADFSGSAVARNAPCYYDVEAETAELEWRSQEAAEEVDLLLRAVQQLGSPLYNPVTDQYVCWNLHPLQKRSRDSYGDIEGVSCDFCGHTDWLDSLVEEEAESNADGSTNDTGVQRGIKKEERVGGRYTTPPAHHRYLYHCPVCEVDICGPCLAEVRADEHFHVPCLQCQRCGAYETRRDAPMHQCGDASGVKKEEEERKRKMEEALSWVAPPPRAMPSLLQPSPPLPPPPLPSESAGSPRRTTGVTAVRGHVRLGLSRCRGGVTTAPAMGTAAVMADDGRTASHAATRLATFSSPNALATSTATAPTRKRASSPRGAATRANTRAKLEEVTSSDDDLPVETMPPATRPRVRRQGALPSREARSQTPDSYVSSPDADQARLLQSSPQSTARYEVHVTPQSAEEAEEVRRIAREQHLVLLPAPSARTTSVAYFPTRLAAESCVDRATVGSVEAILKRHIRDL